MGKLYLPLLRRRDSRRCLAVDLCFLALVALVFVPLLFAQLFVDRVDGMIPILLRLLDRACKRLFKVL